MFAMAIKTKQFLFLSNVLFNTIKTLFVLFNFFSYFVTNTVTFEMH